MSVRTVAGRLAGMTAGVVVLVAGIAQPAFAHIGVEADRAQAGATDVTVTFSAASESKSAGITSLRVVLPTGIAPADVSYVSGPTGWTLTPAADGYTVAGPPVAAGKDAVYAVKIAALPTNTTTLPFKTLQSYTGGRIDRWIVISTDPEAENAAPTLTVKPAAVTASPTPTPSPTLSPSPAETSAAATADAEDDTDGGSNAGWWILLAVAVIGAIGGGLWWARRRAGARGGAS